LQNDDGIFVRVPDGAITKDLPVKLGIRGNDGMVEITDGVKEGDVVFDVGGKTSKK
jgi:multidrug efflux pump subunit AcrA (membrane-fusion protein)